MIGFVSVVEHFAIRRCSISVHISSEAIIALRLVSSLEKTRPIEFEHRFKQIMTTAVEDLFYLSVARILEESLIIQVALIELYL